MNKIRKKNLSHFSKILFLLLVFLSIVFILSNTIFSQENSNMDNDSDGLTDVYEEFLGSNPKDASDVKEIKISNLNYLLVDTNKDNISDVLFDISSVRYNYIKNVEGILHIDSNFDDEWDYKYYKDELEPIKEESFEIPWIFIIVGIIIFLIVLIVISLFKKGILYIYYR